MNAIADAKDAAEAKRLKAWEAEQKRLQKVEIAKFNEVNGTKFKIWDEYQTYLKHIAAVELKFLEKENRKALIQLNIHEEKDEKAALEVADESVTIESNTDTSNSD